MDNNNFTNEEIWNFLKNKMKKNGLTSKVSVVNAHIDDYPNNGVEIINAYYESDVINAIALAYRSGYLRAIKGRPFMIGEKKEKKQSGHWEPVDVEEVLKGACKIVKDCLGWHYEHLGTYKKGEDGRFYQWVEVVE